MNFIAFHFLLASSALGGPNGGGKQISIPLAIGIGIIALLLVFAYHKYKKSR